MMRLADDVVVEGAHDGDPGPPDPVVNGGGHRPPHSPWHSFVMSCSHGRQSMTSSAPEVNPPGELLTIGELARRTGVTASALRYYEELGLLPAPARVSGQRRYPESAATIVAAIRLHSDAGFTLAEQKALLASPDGAPDWRELAQRKLAELDERIARAQAAREAIRYGLRCPRRDAGQRPDFQAICPDFQAIIATRHAGDMLWPADTGEVPCHRRGEAHALVRGRVSAVPAAAGRGGGGVGGDDVLRVRLADGQAVHRPAQFNGRAPSRGRSAGPEWAARGRAGAAGAGAGRRGPGPAEDLPRGYRAPGYGRGAGGDGKVAAGPRRDPHGYPRLARRGAGPADGRGLPAGQGVRPGPGAGGHMLAGPR